MKHRRTYPTFFAVWPDDYTWDGQIQLTYANGDPSTCLSAPSGGFTVTIFETAQPSGDALISSLFDAMGVADPNTALDPQGLSYHLASDIGAQWALTVLSDMFPGSPEVTSCQVESPGPNWGHFTQTQWTTSSSTQYTDGGVTQSPTTSTDLEPITTSTVSEHSSTETQDTTSDKSSAPSSTSTSDQLSSFQETLTSLDDSSSSTEDSSAAGKSNPSLP